MIYMVMEIVLCIIIENKLLMMMIFLSEGNPITVCSGDSFAQYYEAGAEEPKFNCLTEPEPKLGIAAPAPASFLFTTELKIF